MKITCESCSAKYSVPDEKVAGKTFRVRCKRCDAAILVRPLAQESSALFSLSNLRELSQPQVAPSPAQVSSNSGLIDLQALASTLMAPPAAPRTERVSDLMGLGGVSPLAAPVLMPERPRPTRAWLPIGIGACVAVASALVAAVVVVHANPSPVPVARRSQVVLPAAISTPTPAPIPAPAPQVEVAPPPPSAVELPELPHPSRVRVHAPHPVATTTTGPVAEHGEEELDRTIRNLAPRPTAPVPVASGPVTPARSDVMSAMETVSRPVAACGDGSHGMLVVNVTFRSDGSVSDARVNDGPFAPAVRSCAARAVRSAHVPQFRQSSFRVAYPFRM